MNSSSEQAELPLVAALSAYREHADAAFYTPGHKRGQGISAALAQLMGEQVFRVDLPELPELDNLFAPDGAIAIAQALAAQTFGADQTCFLVNGTTCGLEAAMLATCRPGDKILLPRNSHQAAISALVLSGAIPVFLEPAYEPQWGIPLSVSLEAVAIALRQNPDIKAVLMLYPTYHGVCGDIQAIAQLTHQHNIPLIVDEAHGAHFIFHPELPIAALEAGADVVIQSTHKVLGAMTQASMLHLKGNRVSAERIQRSLQLVQSSSPSYVLLASLDAARHQMATNGLVLMQHTLALATQARQQSPFPVLELCPQPGWLTLDPTRLTVDVSTLGLTGYEADEILHAMGITAELPSLHQLTFIISLGNTATDIEQLTAGLNQLINRTEPAVRHKPLAPLSVPEAILSPRDAFFAKSTAIAFSQSVNQICAELICPYPPGIPVLFPGERITQVALEYLQQVKAESGVVTGCADPTLETLQVIIA